jgi:hypothetical protein
MINPWNDTVVCRNPKGWLPVPDLPMQPVVGPTEMTELVKDRVATLVVAIHSVEATDEDVEELDCLTRESPVIAEFARELINHQIVLELLMSPQKVT